MGLTGSHSVIRRFTFTHDRDVDETYDRHPGQFSPNGRLVAVGLKGRGVQLRNARNLAAVGAPLLETGGEVKALAFSPDGRTLAAVTAGGVVTLWDPASRSLRRRLSAEGARAAAFGPDGRTVVTTGRGLELWDVATGARRGRIGGFAPSGDLSFSANGALVAFAMPGSLVPQAEIWDVAKRSLVARMEGRREEGDATAVALSPDGALLAVGGYSRVVRLWDVATGTVVRVLDAGGAGALEFSPDGRILAVSSDDASLWDVATGTQIGERLSLGVRNRTAMIDLSADGRRVLMTLANGEGAVWDVDPASWARRACALANRTLTREEWRKFLRGRAYEPAC